MSDSRESIKRSFQTRHRTMASAVYHDIGCRISAAEGSFANIIPNEAELCREYGVSRIVIREALQMLKAKSIIHTRRSQGTQVRPELEWNLLDLDVISWLCKTKPSPALLMELSELKLAILPLAAKSAAMQVHKSQSLHFNPGCLRQGDTQFLSTNQIIEFNTEVIQASNNSMFNKLSRITETTFSCNLQPILSAPITPYLSIAEAINQGRPQLSQRLMREATKDEIENAVISDR